MDRYELRYRQVHLDFHTSPDIEVGAQFDPDAFAATLERARVDSITCFARCHHGLIYYDSKLNPERVHPRLARRNLLAEQIEACHKRNIRVPIYTSVQWDHFTAQEHPEWRILTAEGALAGQKPYEPGFYGFLCVNTPYRDFLKAHVREVLSTLPVDGLFFDIVGVRDCSCAYCRAGMKSKGLDPLSEKQRLQYARQMLDEFKADMTQFIRRMNPECSIFYNSGHVGPAIRTSKDSYTHLELESLPSGGWGYMHFPITVRYARNLGLDLLGHTGKFHTSWGDFHSFKNREALEYECLSMLAHGAKCLIGDQLEPSGMLSQPVYDLIGSVYSQVEQLEPWCRGARPVVDIGLFTPEEYTGGGHTALSPALIGATRILQRAAHQFDIVDSQSDFSQYRVLVLPDDIQVSSELAGKLERYLAEGGSLIASFESGLNSDKTEFTLKALGVTLKDQATRTHDGALVRGKTFPGNAYADYLLPKGEIGKGLPETEHVMYMKGVEVEALPQSEVLCDTVVSYFDRTYEHFCSHRQTPSSGKRGYAGIVRNGNVIYFAHPIFRLYDLCGPRWCKQLFLNALDMLLPDPVLRHDGPSTLLATVNRQDREGRLVVHLLHYIPERLSQTIDVIEDVIPLHDVRLSLRVPGRVNEVQLVPEMRVIDFQSVGERIEFTIPRINGHQVVCVQLQ